MSETAHFPAITFGMIVLNAEPFIRFNLRSIYPFAHEIIIVEGAVEAAYTIATPDGHSKDNTLAVIQEFIDHEDPDGKVILITDEGFWTEKDAMSQAYSDHATGDYLWQVDADEFYHPQAIEQFIAYLKQHPDISGATFRTLTFAANPEYRVDSWWLQSGKQDFHRLFKWDRNYRYMTHRPPTVFNDRGQDLRSLNWLDAKTTEHIGIVMYHYSLLLPDQVRTKVAYYQYAQWNTYNDIKRWAEDCYFRLNHPFRVHNVPMTPSWLSRYKGQHPRQVQAMWHYIRESGIPVRDTSDIEQLLSHPLYPSLRFMLALLSHIYQPYGWRKRLCHSIFYRMIEPAGLRIVRSFKGKTHV